MLKIFVIVFLLALGASTAVSQEGGVLINLRVDENDPIFVNLEANQIGNRCVSPYLSNFTLFRWDLGIGWQAMGFSPMVEVGNFGPAMRWGPADYRFPATKILHRFFVGSALQSPTIMVALPGYQIAGGSTGECAPVVLNQGAFLVTGTPEAFPFDYRGVGSFSRNVIATDDYLQFEVVGRNQSRILVVQEIRLSDRVVTWQKVIYLPAGGGQVSIPQHSLMQGVAVDVVIHDSGGAVVRENLTTGTRKFVLGEDGTLVMERLDSPYRRLFAP